MGERARGTWRPCAASSEFLLGQFCLLGEGAGAEAEEETGWSAAGTREERVVALEGVCGHTAFRTGPPEASVWARVRRSRCFPEELRGSTCALLQRAGGVGRKHGPRRNRLPCLVTAGGCGEDPSPPGSSPLFYHQGGGPAAAASARPAHRCCTPFSLA